MKKSVSNALVCVLVVIAGLFAFNAGNVNNMDILNSASNTSNIDYVSNIENVNNNDIVYAPVLASLLYHPFDIDDLEMNSDAIILARVLSCSDNILLEFPVDLPKELHFEATRDGYTRTELEVLHVFAGDVAVGDILVITEEYWMVEHNNDILIRHIENYGPSMPEQEYIFFLKKYTKDRPIYFGMYFPQGVDRGRYPVFKELVDASSRSGSASSRSVAEYVEGYTNAELSLANQNSRAYRDLYTDVAERYFSQISDRY